MRYLSLFSGIGGFELGLQGHECVGYSEICPHAIRVYRNRFLKHNLLGPVESVRCEPGEIDLLVAGWPCTDLSIGNIENLGLAGIRSGLIVEVLRLLESAKPKYFCFENVGSMTNRNRDIITRLLGVTPIMIDAALVSPHRRERFFWANFPISKPTHTGARLEDFLDKHPCHSLRLSKAEFAYMSGKSSKDRTRWELGHHHDTLCSKASCLTANMHKGVPYNVLIDRRTGENVYRKFSPAEIERIMGFPHNWTAYVSNTNRYKLLGNSVDVRVVKHIFRELS